MIREAIIRGVGFNFGCNLGVGVGIVVAVQRAKDSVEVPEYIKDRGNDCYLVSITYFTGQDLLDFIKKNEKNCNLDKGTYDRISPYIELDKFYKVIAYDD